MPLVYTFLHGLPPLNVAAYIHNVATFRGIIQSIKLANGAKELNVKIGSTCTVGTKHNIDAVRTDEKIKTFNTLFSLIFACT